MKEGQHVAAEGLEHGEVAAAEVPEAAEVPIRLYNVIIVKDCTLVYYII